MVPKRFFAAVDALLYIAKHGVTHPVRGKDIAKQQQLAPRYLEPVMQRLVHHGILKATRGPKGGYTLIPERRKLSLLDIWLVVAESDGESAEGLHSLIHHDALEGVSATLEASLRSTLADCSFEDLCQDVGAFKDESGDFTI